MRKIAAARLMALMQAVLLAVPLSGCEALAISAFSAGASAGLNKTMDGYAYRTFTAPAPNVRQAALAALVRMGIKVGTAKRQGVEEIIVATAAERDIEISIESLSPNATRMRAVARQGLFNDGATALEIVVQTEKALIKT